jgi:hypothetical protein
MMAAKRKQSTSSDDDDFEAVMLSKRELYVHADYAWLLL